MIPIVSLRPKQLDPLRKKCSRWGTSCKKGTTPPPDDEATRSTSMLPYYVPPRWAEAPKVTMGKNAKYQLVSRIISFIKIKISRIQRMKIIIPITKSFIKSLFICILWYFKIKKHYVFQIWSSTLWLPYHSNRTKLKILSFQEISLLYTYFTLFDNFLFLLISLSLSN